MGWGGSRKIPILWEWKERSTMTTTVITVLFLLASCLQSTVLLKLIELIKQYR